MYKTDLGPGGQKERVIDHLELLKPGKLSPAEYDRHVRDLVACMAEPVERERLGVAFLGHVVRSHVFAEEGLPEKRALKPGAGVEAPIPEPSAATGWFVGFTQENLSWR